MSSTSPASSMLNLTGLVSNTDWQSLVNEINTNQKTASEAPLNAEMTSEQNILSAWQSFNTTLSAVTSYIKTNNLNADTGYQSYTANLTSQDPTVTPGSVLSASVGKGDISPGTYSVEVDGLAAAEKISSDNFSSATTALGFAGDIVINNHTVKILSTYNLNQVASAINNANAGVTASVLNLSPTSFRLTLQSNSQGAAGMSVKDGDASNVLESLNLISGSSLIHPSGSNALSDTYSDQTKAIGTLLGLNSPQTGTIQIQGSDTNWYSVSVNLATDSLQTIATNITNAAIPGVSASVVPVTQADGTAGYQLQVTGVTAANLQDQNNVLATLGVLAGTPKNLLQAGQDAQLKIDGYPATATSNSVTGVIQGVTLSLLGTDVGKPVQLDITQDNSGLESQVNTLIGDVNSALSFINKQNTPPAPGTTASATANVLMGDPNLATMQRTIISTLLENIPGNKTYTTAQSIGINFGDNGSVSLDPNAFASALSDNPTETLNAVKTLSSDLYTNLNVYVDPTTGTLASIQNSVNDKMTQIKDQLKSVDDRCAQQATALQQEYTNLMVLLNQSNQTKNWLTTMVNSMTNTSGSSSSSTSF